MRTEYEIYMDFNKAQEQVEKLRRIASRMRNIADDDFTGNLQSISNNWKGENAEAFLVKGDKVKGNISSTAGDINKVADAIETMALRLRDAELKAIAIAED